MQACTAHTAQAKNAELARYAAAVAKISMSAADAAAAAATCRELGNMTLGVPGKPYYKNEAKTALAVEAGGVGLVSGALRAHPHSAAVQTEGFHALNSLAGTVGGCDAVRGGGGVALLLGGMRGHAQHSGTQRWGCRLTCDLAGKGGATVCAELLEAGAVEVVLSVLRTHGASDPSVSSAACSALTRLARYGGVAGRSVVAASGALDAARAAVAAVPPDHDWVSIAQKALAALEAAL